MKLWTSCTLGLLLLISVLLLPVSLPGCWGGGEPCEEDVDCLILCECPGLGGFVTVGPYQCRMGTCGAQHSEDLVCLRPCGESFSTNVGLDDDDSGADDDDSGADDDDSAAAR